MSDLLPTQQPPEGGMLIFQTEDGRTCLEVRLLNESVWLSLNQMADLFQRDKSVISKHISNVFDEGELRPEATVASYATVQTEGGRKVMRMADWIGKLDDFLRISGREILTHTGKVSHDDALARAETEYGKYRALEDAKPSEVDQHFDEAIQKLKQLEHPPRQPEKEDKKADPKSERPKKKKKDKGT
ncbi:MAG: virulence RhuM family protein [Planctomycetes bacterium]|nr:virulence RhuM family protein [Planctomycetota bacterium]